MGLGYALSEEIHFKDGAIQDKNFDSYALPRFSWLPKIETVILDADDTPPNGGGEPAIILTGAVIGNALAAPVYVAPPPSRAYYYPAPPAYYYPPSPRGYDYPVY